MTGHPLADVVEQAAHGLALASGQLAIAGAHEHAAAAHDAAAEARHALADWRAAELDMRADRQAALRGSIRQMLKSLPIDERADCIAGVFQVAVSEFAALVLEHVKPRDAGEEGK